MAEIRRILVALEPALGRDGVPELAARLAAEIPAEIQALLVEDAAVMAAAELSFAQEIQAPTGVRRSLTREDLDLGFQILARRIELRFAQSAGRAGLHWNLRSVRGDPIAEIVAAAAESDLLMLGRLRGLPLDIAAMRRIAQDAGRPTLFLGDTASPGGGFSVLGGAGEMAFDLLAVIASLARAFPGELRVYRPAATGEDQSGSSELLRLPSEAGRPELHIRMSTIAEPAAGALADLNSRTILVLPDHPRPRRGET